MNIINRADSPTQADGNEGTIPQIGSIGSHVGTLKEPPTLTVICGESSTQALQGTYSWYYPNWDGTMAGIEADCIHPLDAKELMEPLALAPSYLSHIDPFTVYLQFDVAPDSVTISYWGEECWGQTDAAFKENAIYIISATWESYENFGGTASYSFYTTYPLLKTQPIVP